VVWAERATPQVLGKDDVGARERVEGPCTGRGTELFAALSLLLAPANVFHLSGALTKRRSVCPLDGPMAFGGVHHISIMHRLLLARPALRGSVTVRTRPALPAAPLAAAPLRRASATADVSDEELQHARTWLHSLHAGTIPSAIGELSFSRSSGPGGQNVNKYARASWASRVGGAKHRKE